MDTLGGSGCQDRFLEGSRNGTVNEPGHEEGTHGENRFEDENPFTLHGEPYRNRTCNLLIKGDLGADLHLPKPTSHCDPFSLASVDS
jgi:hypothetical protein